MNSVQIPLSVLCPWIRGSFSVGESALAVELANVFLGVIPAGKMSHNIPLGSISGCALDEYYDTKSTLAGIIVCFAGGLNFFTNPGTIIVSLIWILIGACLIAYSIKTIIRVQNNGTELAVAVPFYAKDKAHDIKEMIDKAIG